MPVDLEDLNLRIFYSSAEFSEPVEFTGFTEATISADMPEINLPRTEDFTLELSARCKQAKKLRKLFKSLKNRNNRLMRYRKRLKERIRRAKLKGEEGIKISRRYVSMLAESVRE